MTQKRSTDEEVAAVRNALIAFDADALSHIARFVESLLNQRRAEGDLKMARFGVGNLMSMKREKDSRHA